MGGKRKSSRGLSAQFAKDPAKFKRLDPDQKRKVLELAIRVFGIDGLKDRSI